MVFKVWLSSSWQKRSLAYGDFYPKDSSFPAVCRFFFLSPKKQHFIAVYFLTEPHTIQCVTQICSLLLCKAHSPALTYKSVSCGCLKIAAIAIGKSSLQVQLKREIVRAIHYALHEPKESPMHTLSSAPTCNPTGIATKLENPWGMANAASTANGIS